MDYRNQIKSKILSRNDLLAQVSFWKRNNESIVFSNGCFDIIHPGHVRYLAAAAALGNKLVIGVNTDSSVKRIKGPSRPLIGEEERCEMLASFTFVDAVCLFDEDTPLELIKSIVPHFLVKGKDYSPEQIVGADIVLSFGGKVETIDLVEGYSTTSLIQKIKKL